MRITISFLLLTTCMPLLYAMHKPNQARPVPYEKKQRVICALCLNALRPNTRSTKTFGCQHWFHRHCLRFFDLTGKGVCPACNFNVESSHPSSEVDVDRSSSASSNSAASCARRNWRDLIECLRNSPHSQAE